MGIGGSGWRKYLNYEKLEIKRLVIAWSNDNHCMVFLHIHQRTYAGARLAQLAVTMQGKTLQQVVTEIVNQDVSKYDSRIFAEDQFAQIYAWIKADVISRMIAEKENKKPLKKYRSWKN